MRPIYLSFIALSLALLASGCGPKPVVVVNGEPITEREVQWSIKDRLREHGASGIKGVDPKAFRHSVLQQLVDQKLMAQGAREKGISVSADELKQWVQAERARIGEGPYKEALRDTGLTEDGHRKMVKEYVLSEKFARFLLPDSAVAEEDIVRYYKESPTPFIRPETVLVRYIMAPTEEAAKELVGKIKKAGFDGIADGLAGVEGYRAGAGYTWTNPDINPPAVAKALKRAKAGGIAGPVADSGAYVLFGVRERREQGVKSLDEAREEIRAVLVEQKRGASVVHWVAAKRKESKISLD